MRLHLFCVLLLALEVYSRSAKVTSRREASDPENYASSHEHQSSSFGGDLDLSHWNDIGAPCLQVGDHNVNDKSNDDRCKNLHEWEKALIQLSFGHLDSSNPTDTTNSHEPPKEHAWNEPPQKKPTNQNSETWSISTQQENNAQNQVTIHQNNPWISIPQENNKPSKNVHNPFPNNHQEAWHPPQLNQPSKNIVIPFQEIWQLNPQQNNQPSKNLVPFPINHQETWKINPKPNIESTKTFPFPNNQQEAWNITPKPSREIPVQFLSSKQQESKFYPVESTRSSTKKQVSKEQPVYVHLQMPADIAQHAGEMFGPFRLHLPIKVPEIKLYLAAEVVSAGQGTKQTDGRKRTAANNNNKGPWHQ